MKKISLFLLVGSFLFLISCGRSDKDIYDSAKENLASEKYPEALKDFEILLADYPKSEYYQDALLQAGQLYQGHVNQEIPYEQSLRKAISAYRKFYSQYQNDPKAPQTLFMIGFVQANELKELDSAKATYTKFVETYPDNEMAESARTELENLGLSADEILAKKMNGQEE